MKKLLSIILAVAMILALAVPAVAAEVGTEPSLSAHCNAMTYYEGGYGAIPTRYYCSVVFPGTEEQYGEWFDISYGDPIVAEWPTEVGNHTVLIELTTTIEGAGYEPFTFLFSIDITVLELPATSGKCGDNMTWNFDTTTDTLTISGTGNMYTIAESLDAFWNEEYTYEPGWWYLPVKHVIVEEGVENLSNFAFFQNWNGYYRIHETIQLPTTLKAIPEMGFMCSTAMKSLTIPEGITSLSGWPFGSPGNSFLALEELSLPSTLKELDPMTVLLAGLDSRTAKQTLETIRYAGTEEQWKSITWVESESLREIFGEDYETIREFFAGPAEERLADMEVSYEPKECTHDWKAATCTAPKTCALCGQTEGSINENAHRWEGGICTVCKLVCDHGDVTALDDGDCTTDVICPTCSMTAVAANETHIPDKDDGDCTTAVKCRYCSKIATPAKNAHTPGAAATCAKPQTCTVCGYTMGKLAPHIYSDGLDGTCNVCGIHRETTEKRNVMHMFRMYDPNSGEHFYTGSTVERENLVAAGWHYEGVGFTFSQTTGSPVYRLYDPVYGEHLYTMDVAERDALIAEGWSLEGIAFNSAYDTEVPQYRLHNPNAKRGAYHFTASIEERDFLISLGWEYQGIGFYSSWK